MIAMAQTGSPHFIHQYPGILVCPPTLLGGMGEQEISRQLHSSVEPFLSATVTGGCPDVGSSVSPWCRLEDIYP